jgi:hypothetical protein
VDLRSWQGEVERAAFAGLAFDPDAAAVGLDDVFDDGQTQARAPKAFGVAGFVGTVESFEDAGQMLRRDAGAVVGHADFHLAVLFLRGTATRPPA